MANPTPIDIVIRATDLASPVLDRVARKSADAGNVIRRSGDIGNFGVVKRIGKTIDDVAEAGDTDRVRLEAAKDRGDAYGAYKARIAEIAVLEKEGGISDARRLVLAKERTREAERFRDTVAQSSDAESGDVRNAAIGKIAGAFAIAEGAGRILQSIATQLDAASVKVAATTANSVTLLEGLEGIRRGNFADAGTAARDARDALGEYARAIPGIGTLATGFDKIREANGDLRANMARIAGFSEETARNFESGAAALARANLEAGKIAAADVKARRDIAASEVQRSKLDTIVRRFETPAQGVATDRDAALATLERERAQQRARSRNGVLSADDTKRFTDAEYVIRKEAADKLESLAGASAERIGKLQIDNAKTTVDATRSLQRAAAESSAAIVITALRRQGREIEADYAELAAKFKAERDATAAERQRIALNPGGATVDAAANAALAARDAATNAAEREAIIAAKASEAGRAEQTADRVARIERDIVGTRVEAGDKEGQRALRRIDEIKRVAELEKTISEELRNQSLTAEQRAALEASRAALGGTLERSLANIDRRETTSVQGRGFATASDDRFQRDAVAARSRVETFRDEPTVRETAANTKATAEATKAAAKSLEKLVQKLTVRTIRG